MLAITKRWHVARFRFAKWALAKVVIPIWTKLDAVVKAAATAANDQHDKARMRLEVCKRCPAFTSLNRCKECGCFMPAKVQLPNAKCPQGRWD